MAEFKVYAKARPDGVTYGTPGAGTLMHFAGEALRFKLDVPMKHLAYRGAAPLANDLAVPGRRIAVQWKIEAAEGDAKFRMTWRERGGPPVTTPVENGFGRVLIEHLTSDKLNATALLTFAKDGVTWTLDSAVANVLAKVAVEDEQ